MVGFNSRLIINLADGAILSGCPPSDPVKRHYMSLAAFGTDALDFHFVVVFYFIDFPAVCLVH